MRNILLLILLIAIPHLSDAQEFIKINGNKINRLDKKDRKQGEWIYFNLDATVSLSCVYKDDKIISPVTFFDNKDTAFVIYPKTDTITLFEVYQNKQKYLGAVEHKDQQQMINLEESVQADTSLLNLIMHYLNFSSKPVYFFSQSNFGLEVASRMTGSQIYHSREITAILEINASGKVVKVIFPTDKNKLTFVEEEGLARIYKEMPRWQPAFSKTTAVDAEIVVKHSHNSRWQKY